MSRKNSFVEDARTVESQKEEEYIQREIKVSSLPLLLGIDEKNREIESIADRRRIRGLTAEPRKSTVLKDPLCSMSRSIEAWTILHLPQNALRYRSGEGP